MAGVDIVSLTNQARSGDAQAQYRLAVHFLQRHQLGQGYEWMQRASENGFPDAMLQYANILLDGAHINRDPRRAVALLEAHPQAEMPAIKRMLATQYFLGEGAPADPERAKALLQSAAAAGDAASLRLIGLMLARSPQRMDAMCRVLSVAANHGDGPAQFLLARHLQEDSDRLGEAAHWMHQAALNRFYPAIAAVRKKTLPSPTSPSAVPELEDADLDFDWPEILPTEATVLENSPALVLHKRFLTPVECEYLIGKAKPALQPSKTIDPNTGLPVNDPVRRSSGMNFFVTYKDLFTGLVERGMAAAAELDIRHGEAFAILNYQPGQEYKPHFDAFTPAEKAADQVMEKGGQRVKTVLIYLNDDMSGGGTAFPNRQLEIDPQQGTLLYMENVDDQGNPFPEALHAGLPVEKGEKWLGTLWMRELPYRDDPAA